MPGKNSIEIFWKRSKSRSIHKTFDFIIDYKLRPTYSPQISANFDFLNFFSLKTFLFASHE